MRFALYLDIVNHCDINVLAFHSDHSINFIINIYSNSNQTTLQFLCQNVINLDNTIIMTGNFNIRDNDWDPNFCYYSIYADDLITIADSLGLELSPLLDPSLTRFADNLHNSNSVIDLIFLLPNNRGFGQHTLHPNICKPSDHVLLIIEVGIIETNIDISIRSISKDSEEEKDFIMSLTNSFSSLNSSAIRTKENLENLAQ